ncbi:NAD(P)/FAD-dependent oxidoreductase [Desulfogranum japonicum]|uniref:NAD(P)/FAD-dependent oxidoreductase n=1 Tax=Desulfogranum japonicum TaxID=231447 RepID=UPI000424DD10|nr:FAD-dependent oxidoreductase [Desulfogranum japonicum]
MAAKKMVLIGGGHAHMVTLARLRTFSEKGYEVTVIQPSDYHYYSGMGPGMLGGTYTPDEIRFNTRKVVEGQGGCFIRGKVRRIDPAHQVVSLEGAEGNIAYDVLSCNAGSFVPLGSFIQGPNVFTAKPIEGLLKARQEIIKRGKRESLEIAIIGGGPSGLEIAGNIWQLSELEELPAVTIRILAGKQLMRHHPEKIGILARKICTKRGIEVVEGSYVQEMKGGYITLQDGRSYRADMIFPAIGVKPSAIFAESGLPTGPDGGLLVNEYLQSTTFSNIFGGGDCISFQPRPLAKVGVYAVRANPVLYHNLMAALDGKQLLSFDPGGQYLLIYNLGGGVGILCKWFFIFSGRFAFTIKDHIDRKFIETFQAVEQNNLHLR